MGRTILLFGDIDHTMAAGFFEAYELLDRTKGDITIKICSAGGMTSAGFAIYDRIKLGTNQVTVEAYGEVCSMAAGVLQAADWRRIAPNARLMVHNTGVEVEGSFEHRDLKRTGKELKEIGDMYNRMVSERCDVPIKVVEGWCNAETYFNANAALANNLVDEIMAYPVTPKTLKAKKVKAK
jgi:ATP-dependent Clp protease protease subunit